MRLRDSARNLFRLALADERRWPDRTNAKRARLRDDDSDRLRQSRSLFDARLGGTPCALAGKLGDKQDGTLASGNLDRAIAVEAVQDSASASSAASASSGASSSSGPPGASSMSACAGWSVEMACL
jgi:hypothetical protein